MNVTFSLIRYTKHVVISELWALIKDKVKVSFKKMNWITTFLAAILVNDTFTILLKFLSLTIIILLINFIPYSLPPLYSHPTLMIQKYHPHLFISSSSPILLSFFPLLHQYQSHSTQTAQVTSSSLYFATSISFLTSYVTHFYLLSPK